MCTCNCCCSPHMLSLVVEVCIAGLLDADFYLERHHARSRSGNFVDSEGLMEVMGTGQCFLWCLFGPQLQSHLLKSHSNVILNWLAGALRCRSLLTRQCYDPKDDMSKSSFSTEWELDETALGWATNPCSTLPRRHKNVLFNLLFTRFGKTSRRAARAVKHFVTCSSPASNGFMEDITTTSQESPIELPSSQYATPSTTSTLQQVPREKREKPVRDPWAVRNGVITPPPPPQGLFRYRDTKDLTRPSHRKSPQARAVSNAECNRRASGVEVASAECNRRASGVEVANAECNRRTSGVDVTSTSTCGPKLPSNFFELPAKQRLRAVKHFLAEFTYKPNSETSLQANKQRPLCRLMATARMIVYKPEPIKSVEAVFLALYLTAGLLSVERTPVCFKINFGDEVYLHIVVLVQHNGKYGAFGISRDPDLMTKDFRFDRMSSIIENYLKAYKASAHTVLNIRIGLPVEHDIMSTHFVCWRHLCLSPETVPWPECVVEIENHVLRMKRLWDLWVLTGKAHDPRKAKLATRKVLDTKFKKLPPEKQLAGKQTEKPAPPEAKKPAQTQAPHAISTQRRHWDTESTGSNTEECEHCAQLRRAAPPSDTKRACVTTVKRMKTSDTRPLQQQQQHESLAWDAESFESNTGESIKAHAQHITKPRSLNYVSLAATKQVLKNFVNSNVLASPPPRRRSSGARESARKLAELQPASGDKTRRLQGGPLYEFALAGGKSRAG